ncbi:MAG: hypothetical protein K2X86_04785 [Cytophagaceae bacterium]|nr:hypothetical protein [Cytophagaceae bacterium]
MKILKVILVIINLTIAAFCIPFLFKIFNKAVPHGGFDLSREVIVLNIVFLILSLACMFKKEGKLVKWIMAMMGTYTALSFAGNLGIFLGIFLPFVFSFLILNIKRQQFSA